MIKKITKHVNKKILKSCMAAVIMTATVLGTTLTGEAMSPALYEFDKSWNNSGDAQIYMEGMQTEKIEKIDCGDIELALSDYSVVNDANGSLVTIKESGLQKLQLENGRNSIWAVLESRPVDTIPFAWVGLEENKNEIILDKAEATQVFKITNRIDFDTEFDIDSRYYTVTETDNQFIISFDKDYLNRLEIKDFYVYCYRKGFIIMELVKGDLGDVNCDGKVDLKDAQLSLKASLGIEDITTEISKLGDMDNDGKVALKDVRVVLNEALGIK